MKLVQVKADEEYIIPPVSGPSRLDWFPDSTQLAPRTPDADMIRYTQTDALATCPTYRDINNMTPASSRKSNILESATPWTIRDPTW